MQLIVPATGPLCELHTRHAPKPEYFEKHHIIPQSWQRVWKPDSPSAKLWDPRTMTLCRTSHGNVHFWLVNLMRAYSASAEPRSVDQAVAAAVTKYKVTHTMWIKPKEIKVARMAMDRYLEAGGDLYGLGQVGQWGQI